MGEDGFVDVPPGSRQLTPEQTAALMKRFRSRDTQPELAVRRALHALGLRYRVHRAVPSSPRRTIDIAFPTERLAVFIDGCYWHGCPVHGKTPTTNSDWWRQKIGSNVARDLETNEVLESHGWTVVRRWEHEDPVIVAEQVADTVRRLRTSQ
jgi:DNA mismatch endonuclease (patch repair protein)